MKKLPTMSVGDEVGEKNRDLMAPTYALFLQEKNEVDPRNEAILEKSMH